MGELWWQLWQLVCLGFKARAQLYVCAYSCICAWQQNTNVLFWAYRWLKNALPSFWQSKLLKSRQKDYTQQPISTLRASRGCTQEGHLPRNQIGSISGTMTRLAMKPGRETLQQNYQGQLWANHQHWFHSVDQIPLHSLIGTDQISLMRVRQCQIMWHTSD